jgi:hypothetical protein
MLRGCVALYVCDGLDLRPVELLPPKGVRDIIYLEIQDPDASLEYTVKKTDAISDGMEQLGFVVTLDDDDLDPKCVNCFNCFTSPNSILVWFMECLCIKPIGHAPPRIMQHEMDLPHDAEYLAMLRKDSFPERGRVVRVRHFFDVPVDHDGIPTESHVSAALSEVDAVIQSPEFPAKWLDLGVVKSPVRLIRLPESSRQRKKKTGPLDDELSMSCHASGVDVFDSHGVHKGFRRWLQER